MIFYLKINGLIFILSDIGGLFLKRFLARTNFRKSVNKLLKSKKILIAPLNWGLGHATRCIPIIDELHRQGATVLLASDGVALDILKKEFPNLPAFELPAYAVRYTFQNMVLSMALQMPKILRGVWQEYFWLKRFVKTHDIDIVISDNRYGMFNKKVESIFMTHQVNIKAPFSFVVNAINFYFIKKFDTCWIPDFENEPNLAGSLSHSGMVNKLRVQYLGILSRMKYFEIEKKYKAIVVLSGPEPQRTFLEKIILIQLKKHSEQQNFTQKPFILVRGVTQGKDLNFKYENIEIYNYLTTKDLNIKILESEIMITRSGYSTIMDLVNLGVQAILIPTPGQTEQQYLADTLKNNGLFFAQNQTDFNLESALQLVETYTGFGKLFTKNDSLPEIINELLKF